MSFRTWMRVKLRAELVPAGEPGVLGVCPL
eukprot:SAG31_NODE_1270_length_9065_cov_7.007473_12_plen_30_part_00